MSLNAKSGHGTLIKRNTTTIGELGDITPFALMRNEFEALTQQENIDSYVLGVLRRSPVQLKINLIPSDATHDHLTGLHYAIINNSMDRYDFLLPDSWTWIASGQVQNIVSHAPVDGKLEADITFRFSSKFWINGTLVGS